MKTTFSIIFLALVDNKPKVLTLKHALQEYLSHRQVVIRRRTQFELNKAEERAHILEGLVIALDNVDAVVAGIKQSKTIDDAKQFLMGSYRLTDIQAKAILEMKLQKIASLEQQAIRDEHAKLTILIGELKAILASEERILQIVKEEVAEVKEQYGDDRRTQIEDGEDQYIDVEELIEEKDMIVTISHAGYIKRIDVDTYKQQRRGGRGVVAAGTKDEDWVEELFIANTHSYLLFFTNNGQVHWLKVYQLPEGGRQAKGKPIVNMLQLGEGEKITAFVPVKEFEEGNNVFMATKSGTVKKVSLALFSRPRKGGIRAVTLNGDDKLIDVRVTDGHKQIILATRKGIAIRFSEKDVRAMGRTAAGVKGVTLQKSDYVVGMEVADESSTLLTVTTKGYGKRTDVGDYRLINRGGKGVINIALTEKNGFVSGVKAVQSDDDLMLMSRKGIAIRTKAKDISVIGRSTQGVRVIRLGEGDELVAVERIVSENGNGHEGHDEQSD